MQLSHNLKFASAQGKYGNLNIGNILGHYTYPCQTAYRVFIKIQSQVCLCCLGCLTTPDFNELHVLR